MSALCLVELEPGRRFLEGLKTATFDPWQHERIVEAIGERDPIERAT